MQLTVSPLTPGDLHELYTIMGALEGAAARNLGEADRSARARLAASLDKANRVFEDAGRNRPRNFERMFETHNAFHSILIDGCATDRLRALIEQVRPHVHRYEYLYAAAVGPDYSDSFTEHRAIIRAVRSASAIEAERAVRANWLNSARRLAAARERLPSLGYLVER